MKRIPVVAVLVLLAARTPVGSAPEPVPRPAVDPSESLEQMRQDLREARGLADRITDRGQREAMQQVIARLERRCLVARRQLAALRPGNLRTPVADEDLDRFLPALKEVAFDDRRLARLKDFARANRFTARQAGGVVNTFTFDKGKGQAAILLYPRLTDPDNFYTVLDLMSFPATKAEVRKVLGLRDGLRPPGRSRPASSTASITSPWSAPPPSSR